MCVYVCVCICMYIIYMYMYTHVYCCLLNFIGLPDSGESEFLDSKRPELLKMEQNGRLECREPDSPESDKPMKLAHVCVCVYTYTYVCILCICICIATSRSCFLPT